MKIIRQKLFAKGVMGQLKKLESLSRGIKRAEEEAIKKGINPNSSDLVNKKRFDYINAQGALLDKGVPNPDKVKVKHTKTVPLKERTVRLTREERLAKWDPSKQYNHNNPSHSKELLLKMSNISSKRPGTVGRYISDVNKFFNNKNLDGLNNYKTSFLDRKLKEANDSLSSKDKRILRKTIINEAKKAHIKPGNIKSSLENDKDRLKVPATKLTLTGRQGRPVAIAIPKNYDFKIGEEIRNGNTNANKKFIKKVQYGSGPKYSFATAHEIGHLKNIKKGIIGNENTMSKEHFANNLGKSMKGNLGKTYDRFAKYQEDSYNKSLNYYKFNKLGKKLLG